LIGPEMTVPAVQSPDQGDATMAVGESLSMTMNGADSTEAEQLLRGLAACDEGVLGSVLGLSPPYARSAAAGSGGALPAHTSALVHVAALLATGACTTSLRWAVELALRSGARDEEIVEVLVTTAAIVGSARVVAEAPRLALAIGYDIEVEGWDGD
jgi:4-carboxymuconolactone decarboxylase